MLTTKCSGTFISTSVTLFVHKKFAMAPKSKTGDKGKGKAKEAADGKGGDKQQKGAQVGHSNVHVCCST